MGETLDDGVDLGQVTSALGKAGINALDSNGKMRDVGDVMEDLMDVWGQMDQTQKAAIATTLAGKYQLARFEALMNRSDLYDQYKQSAQEGKDKGTLDVMNEKYLDSMEGKLNKLQATVEGVFNDIFESSDFYTFIDNVTNLVDTFSNLTDAIGGGDVALQAFGATALRIFSSQIGTQIGNGLQNMAVNRQKRNNSKTVQENLNALGFENISNGRLSDLRDSMLRSLDLSAGANDEQRNNLNRVNDQLVETKQAQIKAEQELIDRANALNVAYGDQLEFFGDGPIEVNHKSYKDTDGRIKVSAFREEADTKGLQAVESAGDILGKEGLDKLHKKYLSISTAIEQFTGHLNNARDTLIDETGKATGAAFAIEKLEAAFERTKKVVPLTTEQLDSLQQAFDEVEKASLQVGEAGEVNIDALTAALENAIPKARSLGDSFQRLATNEAKAKEYVSGGSAGLQAASDNSQIARQQNKNARKDAEAVEDQIDFSQKISSIVDMVGAVGQIAMSLESLSSLGDIWDDSSITTTEKLNSTLLNLAITLPMVGSGVKDLLPFISKIGGGALTSAKNISIFGSTFKELADSVIKPAQGMKQSTDLMGDLKTAAQLSSEKIGGLGKAFKGLAGPIGIAVAALAAFAAYSIGSEIDKNSKAIEEAQTKASDTKSAYESTQSDVSSFKALYESYKQTGQVSDEMKESADKLADSLGLQSERVMATKGYWDLFAKSVDNATQKQKENTEQAEKTAIYANQKDLNGGWFTNGTLYKGSVQEEIRTNAFNLRDALGDTDSGVGYYNQDKFDEITGLSAKAINEAETFGQQYQLLKQAQESLNDEIDKLNAEDTSQMDDTQKQVHASNLENATNWQNKIKEIFDSRLSNQYQQYSDYSDMRIGDEDIQRAIARGTDNFKNMNYQLQQSDSVLAEFVQSQGDWSSQLQYLIQNTTDDVIKNKLTAEQARTDLSSDAYNYYNANNDNASEEDKNNFADSVYDKLKSSNLSDEQTIQLKASIDPDLLIKNLDNIIADINDGKSVDDIVLEYTLKQDPENSTYENDLAKIDGGTTDQDISNRITALDDDGVTVDTVSKMADAYSEATDNLKEYKQQLNATNDNAEEQIKKLKQQKKALEASGESTEEVDKNIASLSNSIKKSNNVFKDLVLEQYEAQKGAEQCGDAIDNFGDILRGPVDLASTDYVTALGDMTQGLQNFLAIDMSDWSMADQAQFVANNMSDIEAAIDGDYEAYMRLKNTFVEQELRAKINIDDENFWNQLSTLQEYAASEWFAELEAGATLDDTQFAETLNAMIQSVIAAGGDVEAFMNAIEAMDIKANVSWEEIQYEVPSEEGELGALANPTPKTLKVPKISFTKTGPSTTNFSNYIGANRGNTGGSGNGKGSGGSGGSGSGSTYEPKTKDLVDDEPDRYEKVNTQLEKIGNELDKIADEQDRLTGEKLAQNMEKQIKFLQRQRDIQKEKLQIQQQEAQELQNRLSSQYGVQFDSEGYMSNYYSVHQGLIDKINNLTNQYNNTSDEAGQESLEKQIEEANKALDKFNTDYQRYDELWSSDLEDTLKALEDIEDQIEDIRISAFKTAVEAADNIKEIQESLIEFNSLYKDIYQEDPFNSAADSVKKLGKYFDVATGNMSEYYDTMIAKMKESAAQEGVSDSYKSYAQAQIAKMEAAKAASGKGTLEEYGTGYLDMAYKNVNDIMEQINQFKETGKSDIFGEDSADMYDVAKDIFDQATSMASDFASEVKNLRDLIIDCIDQIADEAERRQNSFQAITDQLEHQLNIVQMLHGENAYDEMNAVLAAQQSNYKAQITDAQKVLDTYNELLAKLPEGSKEWQEVQDKIIDAQSSLNDLVETSLENMQKQYENTVNKITNAWVKGALGTDIDWMSTQWELINRNVDYYLDDVNKAYNIQKLQGKYLELLDGSNDLSIQQKITDQMKEQLDYLRDKTKLSEYDVQHANAQLEILQKQIALEEAQRNKNQMKLRRDSQGNYSYVYTANQDNVRSAQSDLLDAQNNAYNLSKDQMKQTQDDSLSALKDAQSTINDIWTNANLTLEEKQKRTQTIIDSLKEYLAATSEQLGESEKNIINDFLGMCETLTDENKSDLQDVYDQIINGNNDAFDQIDTRWQTSLTDWLQHMEDFNQSTDQAFEDLISNGEEWQKNVSEIAGLVQTDFTNTTDVIDKCKDATSDLVASSKDFFNLLDEQSGSIVDYESKLQSMTNKITDMDNAMAAYREQVNDLANQLTQKEQENFQLYARIDELEHPEKYGKGGSSGNGSGSGGADADTAYRIANSIWGTGDKGGWYDDPDRSRLITERFGYAMYEAVQALFNSGYGYNWIDYGKGYEHYDTGGYTGEWGQADNSNGRFAMLHQKELVLNESDTANILEAVKQVREIANSDLASILSSAKSSLSGLANKAVQLATGSSEIDQNVHITAEFPNADSAEEIRSALESLNGFAAQYAFRTK